MGDLRPGTVSLELGFDPVVLELLLRVSVGEGGLGG